MQSAKESFLEIVSALGNSKNLYEHEINAVIDELNIVESLRDTIVRNGEKKTERELILDKSFKFCLSGVSDSSALANIPAILPTSVNIPVLVTTPIPRP